MDKNRTVAIFLMALLLAACKSEEPSGCPRPPEGFSPASLAGTWAGTIDTAWDSTIIISTDGRYKQIVNIKRTGFNYESDWLPWQLEYSQQGVAYLHLKSMMLCGAYYYDVECTEKNAITGFGTNWYDACQQKWDYIHDEGVFRVYPGSTPQEIQLLPLTKSSEGPTGPWYELREPASPTSERDSLSTSEPRSTPDVSHCISAVAWNSTAEPEAAKAARDGICVEIGGERFVKHSIGAQISRGGSQGGVYIIWAPHPLGLVMVGEDWMAQVIGTAEVNPLKREGDKLFPENSSIPVLQGVGNGVYVALVNFYEQVSP